MRAGRLVAAVLGVAIAAGSLAWAYQRAGGPRLVDPLRTLALWVLLPALVCETLVQLCKAWKWQTILAANQPVAFGSTLKAVLVGGMATHIVPLRLDELIRAKILGDAEGLPPATVLGTVAVDRVIEVLVLGCLLGVIAATGNLTGPLEIAVRVAWGGFLVGATALTLFVFAEAWMAALLERWTGPGADLVHRLGGLVTEMAQGLRSLPRGAGLGKLVIATVGEWSATLTMYALVLVGFGLPWSSQGPLVLSVGGAAAYGVPNVPGAIGTYEAAQAALLETLLAVPPDQALAVALVAHAILTIPVTVAGFGVALGMWLRRSAHLDR